MISIDSSVAPSSVVPVWQGNNSSCTAIDFTSKVPLGAGSNTKLPCGFSSDSCRDIFITGGFFSSPIMTWSCRIKPRID